MAANNVDTTNGATLTEIMSLPGLQEAEEPVTGRVAHAATYSTFARHQRRIGFRIYAQFYSRIAALPYPCQVLDVGCGSGETTRLLSYFPNVDRVMAVDRSPGMIAVAETFNAADDCRMSFHLADIETGVGLPPECRPQHRKPLSPSSGGGGTFDLVCSMELFHLIHHLSSVLERIRLCLKPGGLLLGYTLAQRHSDPLDAVNDYLRRTGVSVDSTEAEDITPAWYDVNNPETVFAELLEAHGFRVLSSTLEEDTIISSKREALGSLALTSPISGSNEGANGQLTGQAADVYLSGLDKLSEDRYSETMRIVVFCAQRL